MKHHHDFRRLKNATLEPTRRSRGGRTDMKVAGNPDVFKEAEVEEDYAKGDGAQDRPKDAYPGGAERGWPRPSRNLIRKKPH